jgi:hypothetical protein
MVRGTVSGESAATISARHALLLNDVNGGPHRLEFRLELEKARMRDAGATDAAAQTERALIPITGLTPSPNPALALLKMPSRQLLGEADRWVSATPADDLEGAASDVFKVLARLKNVVLSQQNERLALAVSCAVMVLTGAMTALLLSRRMPLTVYLWTFFPAIASMVTISGGQQATTSEGPVGLILMWSGVGGLALYSLVVFRVLARH